MALWRARVGARLEELDADAPPARPARLGSPGGHGTPLSDGRGNLAAGTLVLISRTGGGIPDDDELARISAGRELEVLLAVAPWRPSVHTQGQSRRARVSHGDAVGRRDRGLCRGGDVRADRLRRAPGRPVARAGAGAARRARRRGRRRSAPPAPRRRHARERRRRVQQPRATHSHSRAGRSPRRSCRSGGRCCGSIGGRLPLVAMRCWPPAHRTGARATPSPRPTGAGASR